MFLYFISDIDFVKIGVTERDVSTRLKGLQCGNPRPLHIERVVEMPRELAYGLESLLHFILRKHAAATTNSRTEWFHIDAVKHVLLMSDDEIKGLLFGNTAPVLTVHAYTPPAEVESKEEELEKDNKRLVRENEKLQRRINHLIQTQRKYVKKIRDEKDAEIKLLRSIIDQLDAIYVTQGGVYGQVTTQ